ncbi:MAG TPA: ATP synthase subunit I [Myxococcota bacterium]|nr:ATP synthase subunit I [Myxococcota bacterium]
MNEPLSLALALLAGALLGMIFFGGLWWTVRRAVSANQPALWFFGSLVLRTGIALAGILLVSGGFWERLLLCLVGFTSARFTVVWLTGPPSGDRARSAKAVRHAP